MKLPIVLHKFRLPVFRSMVWILVGSDIRELFDYVEDKTSEKVIEEEKKNSTAAHMYAYETEYGVRKYILFFKYSTTPGQIAHEVKHMINIIFKWHGYKLSLTNDEMECYYLEDMIDRVHYSINKYRNTYKKPKQKRLDQKDLNAILS